MNFLVNPLWFGLALLLPVIVVMYLLKLRRRRVVMPSTLLWRRAVQDMVANAPFQKLRNNLLMYLQLLLLALLILAFWRPVMKLADRGGQTVILIIDNSASMQVVEADGRTRLEIARERALDVAATLRAADEAIVMTFADRTNIVQTLTSDRGAVRSAIQEIEALDVGTSLAETGVILQGLTTVAGPAVDGGEWRRPKANVRTVLFSDGAARDTTALVDVPALEYVRVGETENNRGISGIDVREFFVDGYFQRQIFASVTNAADQEATVLVDLEVDGEVLDRKAVTVGPRASAGVVFGTAEDARGVAQVKLVERDALSVDDVAHVSLSDERQVSVLLVSEGNYFVEQVLNIDPRINARVLRPVDFQSSFDDDIVIFDSMETGELPPGSYLFINCLPRGTGFSAAGEKIQNPRIVDWNRVHPLSRFANFEEVLVGEAMDMEIPGDAVPIVEALETPLIVYHENDTQRVVVVGFDLFKSYWPLDVSFPIFISNMVEFFARGTRAGGQPAFATGSSIAVVPPRDASAATVTPPGDGAPIDFSFEGVSTAYLTETARAGVYNLRFDDGSPPVPLAVSLLSENESLIAPAESIDLGNRTVEAVEAADRTNQEVWRWFVLAALGVLLLEWGIYCKRTFM